jgi:hypothetical protein
MAFVRFRSRVDAEREVFVTVSSQGEFRQEVEQANEQESFYNRSRFEE